MPSMPSESGLFGLGRSLDFGGEGRTSQMWSGSGEEEEEREAGQVKTSASENRHRSPTSSPSPTSTSRASASSSAWTSTSPCRMARSLTPPYVLAAHRPQIFRDPHVFCPQRIVAALPTIKYALENGPPTSFAFFAHFCSHFLRRRQDRHPHVPPRPSRRQGRRKVLACPCRKGGREAARSPRHLRERVRRC